MICTYERSGGMARPADNELLAIEDGGTFTMWRSIGWATVPPTPVGRFAGRLSETARARLVRECKAASAEGDITARLAPGIPIETIETAEATAEVTPGSRVAGAWGPLLEHLRELLLSLAGQPVAALGLEIAADRRSARLVHLGSEPLRLDLGELSLLVSQRSPTGATLGEWRLPATDLGGEVTAEPGWALGLPFDHGLAAQAGSDMTVVANLTVYDEDDLAVPVSLAGSPPN